MSVIARKWRPTAVGQIVVDDEPVKSVVISRTPGVPDKEFTIPRQGVCLVGNPVVAMHICTLHNAWLESMEGGGK